MSIWESIVLGVIQGLTEFLPVSSSGHIEIGQALLGTESLKEQEELLSVVCTQRLHSPLSWFLEKIL